MKANIEYVQGGELPLSVWMLSRYAKRELVIKLKKALYKVLIYVGGKLPEPTRNNINCPNSLKL